MDQTRIRLEKTREIAKITASLAVFFALWLFAGKAQATFLDTDATCQNFGCVIVGDGTDFSVYDAYIFATNTCCVAAGQPLILWAGGTLVGAGGPVTTVVTGTMVVAVTPTATQYTRMGLDTNADGTADVAFADPNANSFLDAADTQATFSIVAGQRVALVTRLVNRSLYMTSRMDFDVFASSVKATSTGTFGPAIALANVGVVYSMTANGNDGAAYGAAAQNNPGFVPTAAITNLGQLSPGPTRVAQFQLATGIRQANSAGANIMPQCVRFNAAYTLPIVGLATGAGLADIDVTYNFYQR